MRTSDIVLHVTRDIQIEVGHLPWNHCKDVVEKHLEAARKLLRADGLQTFKEADPSVVEKHIEAARKAGCLLALKEVEHSLRGNMNITKFKDIPQFPRIYYSINLAWDCLDEYIERQQSNRDGLSELNLNPDFQRDHVWTREQQIAYVEFILSGGSSGRHLYFNHPGWMGNFKGEFVLVDGKQRITAALRFLHNEIPAFGSFYKDYEDRLPNDVDFMINIAKIPTRKEVLEWYVLMNSGGTPHSQSEIERIKSMINDEN